MRVDKRKFCMKVGQIWNMKQKLSIIHCCQNLNSSKLMRVDGETRARVALILINSHPCFTKAQSNYIQRSHFKLIFAKDFSSPPCS